MAEKTQNLNLRLVRKGIEPAGAVRDGVKLEPWPAFKDAQIATGPMGGGPPGWTGFLELSQETGLRPLK